MPIQKHARAPVIKERYAALLEIARVIAGKLRPDELYRAIYEETSRVLEAPGFYISLYDPASDIATVVFYADRGRIEREHISYRGSSSLAIREARPVLQRLQRPEDALMLLGEDSHEITRSSITAPMKCEGRVIGSISAQSYREDAYGVKELELLAAVADVAAVACDNARQVGEIERRTREAERLEEIGRALASSLDLPEVLQRIVTAARELTEADTAVVCLIDGAKARIEATAGPTALPQGGSFVIPPQAYELLITKRQTLVLDGLKTHPLLSPELRATTKSEAAIAAPLVADDQVIGLLAVTYFDAHEHQGGEVRLLERLSHHAAMAVQNARLHEQIRVLSLTDPLTGLPNRRQLELVLEREFAAAERGRALTVLLFDLDRFKEYNDTAGHQAGDQALCAFARVLAKQTRAMNLAARYGGDEFISVLSGTAHEGGITHAERIAEAVAKHPLLGRIGLGVSAGVASYERGMHQPEDLIRAADRDLYRSKGAKR